MRKVIILEGHNNSGKTTTAQQIVTIGDKLGQKWKIVKCSQPKDGDAYREYSDMISMMENDESGCNFIVDRFHLGETVYPKIKMRKSTLVAWRFEEIEGKLKSYFEPMLIYCKTDVVFAHEMNTKNKEDFIFPEEVEREISLFDEAFERSQLRKMSYDWRTDLDQRKLLKFVFERDETLEEEF